MRDLGLSLIKFIIRPICKLTSFNNENSITDVEI